MNESARQNIQSQKLIVIVAVVLFGCKVLAWYLTQSVAILTDAMESTVNVISGFIGLYSLYVSARPRDHDHPYGHGKAEFLSAAIEGTLITVAGAIIIYEAIYNLQHPHELGKLDFGIGLVAFAGLINYIMGSIAIRRGKANKSLALIASGKHLISDTWSTIGIIIGLVLMFITGIKWIDSVTAMIFAVVIMYSGVRIIRESVAGIMDEQDKALVEDLVVYLNANRHEKWIDLHNLRIIKYGSVLHLDCHLTVPWYINVHQAHDVVDVLDKLIKERYGSSIELFVHTDGCLDFSCKICDLADCPERKHELVSKLDWTVENISSNKKHSIGEVEGRR